MGQVVSLSGSMACVDVAWDRYHALVKQAIDNPALNADRAHVQATIRAHKAFADAFLASEKA